MTSTPDLAPPGAGQRGWHALAAMHSMVHRRQLQRMVARQKKRQ